MNAFPSKFFSDNRRLAIPSPKWGGLFALGVILTLCGAVAEGQQPTKLPRIGFLSPTSDDSRVEAFRQGLRELSYIEVQNITIDYRWADGRFEQLPDLAIDRCCSYASLTGS